MFNFKNNKYIPYSSAQLGDLAMRLVPKIELPIMILCFVAAILTFQHIIDLSFVILILAVPLAVLYYFIAFSYLNIQKPSSINIFYRRLLYISTAIYTISILFYLNSYNGSDGMVQIALTSLAITLVVYFFFRIKAPSEKLLSGLETRRLLIFIVLIILCAVDVLELFG